MSPLELRLAGGGVVRDGERFLRCAAPTLQPKPR
jgi:hypothetical protein